MSDTPHPAAQFHWFYRRQRGIEDHVISLCTGHAYLTKKGGWKPGAGDMAPMPPATGCCACNGMATIKRFRGAPLKPSDL